ncbi:diacylglycerol kinase family protein [Candidatus Woesebacteria bacterium]|nr:diacylglycerol kinase family protein [Candidatus Woesebacteria bacterium]
MIRKHADSIGHAMDGLMWALRTQHNYRAHLFLVTLSILGGILFQITYTEWLVILSVTLLGLIIETINTSIEKLGDAISKDFHPDIKIAKDVSAAAMLIYAGGAAIAASMIFLPRILSLLTSIN